MCMRVFSNNYLQLGKCTVHMSAWQKYWCVPKTYALSKYWFTPKSTVFFYVFIFLYLIGAPLAWAGLSSTVMVVAVSLRKASDPSYSSIVGAEERTEVCIKIHVSLCSLCKFEIIKTCKHIAAYLIPEIFVVTFSVVAGPNPLEVDARIDSRYVTPGWSWEKIWWVAFEGRETVSPGCWRGTEGSNERMPL